LYNLVYVNQWPLKSLVKAYPKTTQTLPKAFKYPQESPYLVSATLLVVIGADCPKPRRFSSGIVTPNCTLFSLASAYRTVRGDHA